MTVKNILVIDDDKDFAKIVREALDPAVYDVQSAGDGEEGLSLIKKSSPDVILLDIMMPRMGGIEFLRQLKGVHGGETIPVIVTSNDSSIERISESVELGVRSYIIKSNESLESIKKSIESIIK